MKDKGKAKVLLDKAKAKRIKEHPPQKRELVENR
jgi:hypothetical protein